MCTEYVAQRGSFVETLKRQNDRISDSSSATVSIEDTFVGLLLGRIQTRRKNRHHATPATSQHSPREFRSSLRFRSRFAS